MIARGPMSGERGRAGEGHGFRPAFGPRGLTGRPGLKAQPNPDQPPAGRVSARVNQPQFPGLRHRITDRFDALGFDHQSPALGGGNIVQRQSGNLLLIPRQHHHQQLIALMPGQGAGRLGDGGDGVQRLLRLTAEGVGQGQVAAVVEVVGLQAEAFRESGLCRRGLAIQDLGDAQARVGDGQVVDVGSLAQRSHGALGFAQLQLRSAETEQGVGVVGVQAQRLLVSALGAECVLGVKPGLAELEPHVDTGSRLLGGALVQRSGAGIVAALAQVIGQLQGLVGIGRRFAGAGSQQQGTGKQKILGHRHNSSGEGAGHVSIFLLALLWLFSAGFAHAGEEPEWFSTPYAYVLVDQDVRSALEEFGHNLDVPVVLSEKVRGKARSTLRAATAGEFLQTLCSTNGLTWYFDGHLLYLNSSDEISTKLFKASALNLDQLQAYLNTLDVFGQQLSMRNGPEGDEVFVTGPPPYLALVQQHVDHLQPTAVAPPMARERGVRVFRGAQVSTETPTQ
ncbi:MAG: hypothetical protein QOI97_2315 [Pseudomonas sp.]|nr:hypothetical protein [Pseudomonas sp.]